MGDLELTYEFVKFLQTELKEVREQLQQIEQENASLREELDVLRLRTGGSVPGPDTTPVLAALHAQVSALREELVDARSVAAARQAEVDVWRTRYEQLKPQLARVAAHAAQLCDNMRDELSDVMEEDHRGTTPSAEQFRSFLSELPAAASSSNRPQSELIVFRSTHLPLLSKAAINACTGGYAFFGECLKWFPSPSQHAYVVFPEFLYHPKPVEGESSWTRMSQWTSLAGQQRELFYVDADSIIYAGTFFCHAGPKAVKVDEAVDEADTLMPALARKTFHVDTKTQKAKAKTYIPLLVDLYAEGTATVQLLGLQRVGFNEKLFSILSRAYNKRDRHAAAFSDALEAVLGPPGEMGSVAQGQKRGIEHVEEGEAGNPGGGSKEGASKIPRVDGTESVMWPE